MATAGIDFFRVDRSGATRKLLIIATGFVCAGATGIGAHLVHQLSESFGHLMTLIGGLFVISGLVLGFGAMAMLLFENVYLLIREDGLLLHDNGKETTVAWPDLEDATIDKQNDGFVVFRRKEGTPLRWFAGSGATNVRTRVEDARRKALHGLLK